MNMSDSITTLAAMGYTVRRKKDHAGATYIHAYSANNGLHLYYSPKSPNGCHLERVDVTGALSVTVAKNLSESTFHGVPVCAGSAKSIDGAVHA